MTPMTSSPSDRTAVRRKPDRARYDAETVHAILDEALYCHVGVVRDGSPVVIPTIHARDGDRLYLHGSPAAGMFRDSRRGVEICVTVTIVDGLVLARSARNHSLNYRSVVVFGRAQRIEDPAAKAHAFRVVTDHVVPGRWDRLRPMSDDDVRQTDVWSLDLAEASAKVRSGPPGDPEPDLALPIWAGVLPVGLVPVGPPVPEAHVPAGLEPPEHVLGWSRSRTG